MSDPGQVKCISKGLLRFRLPLNQDQLVFE